MEGARVKRLREEEVLVVVRGEIPTEFLREAKEEVVYEGEEALPLEVTIEVTGEEVEL